MVDWLNEVLIAHRLLLSIIVLTLIAAIIIMNYWDRVKFWWTCTWYSFPLIGKISKLSKDITSLDEKNWFSSETTLCSDFHRYYDRFDKDPEHYDRCKSYLSKVEELGRKPFPKLMWAVVFALVILEALAFAYVLAGFTMPGASESLQQYGAFGIALIISIILVGLTHWTGHQIYKNDVIKKIRISYSNDRRDDKPDLDRNTDVTLEKDYKDNDAKNYQKILNRVSTNATKTQSWLVTIATGIFIVVIAIGATYVRGQVLEKQLGEEKSMTTTNVYEQALPSSIITSQENADSKVIDEGLDNNRKGGWATFIVLAVLFVFIQILGIIFGFKWGFVGNESLIAYEDSYGFKSKQDFINYFKREKDNIAKIAEQKLKLLQQRMYQKGSMISTSAKEMDMLKTKDNRTFLQYILDQDEKNLNFSEKKESQNRNATSKNEDSINCKSCNSTLSKDTKFCKSCGTKAEIAEEKTCIKCNEILDNNSKFCSSCGEVIVTKELIPTCPQCQAKYEINVKYCSNDGKELELI